MCLFCHYNIFRIIVLYSRICTLFVAVAVWFYIFSNFNSLTLSMCPLTDTLSPFNFVLISAIEITAGLRCSWIRSSVTWLSFEVSIILCEMEKENYCKVFSHIHEKLVDMEVLFLRVSTAGFVS